MYIYIYTHLKTKSMNRTVWTPNLQSKTHMNSTLRIIDWKKRTKLKSTICKEVKILESKNSYLLFGAPLASSWNIKENFHHILKKIYLETSMYTELAVLASNATKAVPKTSHPFWSPASETGTETLDWIGKMVGKPLGWGPLSNGGPIYTLYCVPLLVAFCYVEPFFFFAMPGRNWKVSFLTVM